MSDRNIYKRCPCRDPVTKKMTGPSCPKLRRKDGSWNPKHGTWYFSLELPKGLGGKRRAPMRRGGFESRDDAIAAREAAKATMRRGADPSGRLTTGEYLTAWAAGLADLKSATIRSYRIHTSLYLVPLLGHIPLDRLNGTDIAAMFTTITSWNNQLAMGHKQRPGQRHVGPAGMQRILATLRSALSDALRPGNRLITDNPAIGVRMPAVPRPKPTVWTPERTAAFWKNYEKALIPDLSQAVHPGTRAGKAAMRAWARQEGIPVRNDGPLPKAVIARYLQAHPGVTDTPAVPGRRVPSPFKVWCSASLRPCRVMVWTLEQCGVFLDACAGHRLELLFELIAVTGLRKGEACGLPWEHLDLGNASGWVKKTLVTVGWDVEEGTPKTGAGERQFPVPPGLAVKLRAWRTAQTAERLAGGRAYTHTGLVFTQEDGSYYHPSVVLDVFQRIAFEAGLPPVNLHGLRHGAATYLLAAGYDLKVIQELLGHSAYQTTANIYTSVLPDITRQAITDVSGMIPRAAQAGCESAVSTPVPRQTHAEPREAPTSRGSQVAELRKHRTTRVEPREAPTRPGDA